LMPLHLGQQVLVSPHHPRGAHVIEFAVPSRSGPAMTWGE
jgi:hypothetical protein